MKIFFLIDKFIDSLSKSILLVNLFFMLTLTLLGIILRWFNQTFLWIEPLVRHLVFFTAFLGGVLATGKRGHIGIDLLSKYLENKWPKLLIWQSRVVNISCSLSLLWLTFASYSFFKVEVIYGKEAFLGIHSSVLVFIIPFGLSLCSYRFFYQFLSSFTGGKN